MTEVPVHSQFDVTWSPASSALTFLMPSGKTIAATKATIPARTADRNRRLCPRSLREAFSTVSSPSRPSAIHLTEQLRCPHRLLGQTARPMPLPLLHERKESAGRRP